MSFDINKAGDFAALTLGSAASILQTLDLAGRNPAQWDIEEGSYNGVLFHVFKSQSEYNGALKQVSDAGGRRKVRYSFPYQDGQTTDDLGRKPESFDMDILLFGSRYITGLTKLLAEFNKPTPGDLVHPVRGKLRVVVEEVQLIHSNDQRKAVALRVVFTEHNFTIGDIRQQKDTSVKGALSAALGLFSKINNAITQVLGAVKFAFSLRQQIIQSIQAYKDVFGSTLQDLNGAFNTKGSSDIPGLLPVSQGGVNPGTGQSIAVSLSPNDPLVGVPLTPTTQTSAALAASQMTKQVNAARAQLKQLITDIEAMGNGAGSLDFHDEIVDLKQSGVTLQDVLEKGIASSRAQIVDYVVPRTMSLREVAFANAIDVQRVVEVAILNPSLESINFISKGTTVRVPVS